MPTTTLDQLENHYPEVIAQMPSEFDSHEFILTLAQSHQRDYIAALQAYSEKDSPFMIVHGEIARRLLNYPKLVLKTGEHNSPDIFGQVDSAVIWRKI